ncbi:BatD family protein, partial [bacterium]|nr:BatD family protein [bacterium]
VRIQGQEYQVIEIKTALFPTTAGKLTINPASLVVQTRDFRRRSVDPFGDSFFQDFFSGGQQVKLSSEPINLEVKPIPREGRPKKFSGTVGQWSLSAKLDRKQARVGEALTLETRIFGEGNVKSVGKPRLPALKGFKVYETVSSSEVQKQKGRVKGVKIYRTLIRPEVTGKLTIPPIIYNYFNPRKGSFEKLEVPSLSLEVLPGKQRAMTGRSQSASEAVGSGVKVVAEDIRYLKTNFFLKPLRPWPAWVWITGFLLPPIGLFALGFWQRRQDQLASDPRYARRLRADQSARRALHQARTQRLRRDAKAFYASLSQALTWYLADHMGVSRSGITQREIVQKLRTFGAEEDMMEQLSVLFDECDFARFAPSAREAAEMERHEQQAEELLVKLGRILSKERKG